jgi:hypothetical protein
MAHPYTFIHSHMINVGHWYTKASGKFKKFLHLSTKKGFFSALQEK